jgi:hypothetical protein
MYVCVYIRMYVCMFVCMYVCMFVCLHVVNGRFEKKKGLRRFVLLVWAKREGEERLEGEMGEMGEGVKRPEKRKYLVMIKSIVII